MVGAWAVILAALLGLVLTNGGQFDDTFEIPGAPSQVALDELKMTFPQAADLSATMLVVPGEGHTMASTEVRHAVEGAITELEKIDWVTSVQTPYNEHLSGVITDSGDAGLVTIRVEGTMSTFTDSQRADLNAAGAKLQDALPGSAVHLGGEAYSVEKPKVGISEVFGLAVALVVLLLVLGSLRAALMPLISGVLGAALALMLILVSADQVPSTHHRHAGADAVARRGHGLSLFIVSRQPQLARSSAESAGDRSLDHRCSPGSPS